MIDSILSKPMIREIKVTTLCFLPSVHHNEFRFYFNRMSRKFFLQNNSGVCRMLDLVFFPGASTVNQWIISAEKENP